MRHETLIARLRGEADLCSNEHADDIAALLNDAADALRDEQLAGGRIIGRRVVKGLDVFQVSPNVALPFELVRYEEYQRLDALLNTPEFHDFIKAVPLEAAHQVERWGTEHDAGKTDLDWFWLIGYLSQRVIEYDRAGNHDKALHHCVTTAAALANWHAALEHRYNGKPYPMRPGHAPAVAEGSSIESEEE